MNSENNLEIVKPIFYNRQLNLYLYPSENRIAVSTTGRIFNTITKKYVKCFKDKKKYIVFVIKFNNEKARQYKLHRVLARTFIGRHIRYIEKDFNELEVNHKDGDKTNNRLDNLEWVTSSKNILHAHRCLIHSKDRKVMALNILTNKLLQFNSSKHCAEFFGIKRSTLWKHLNNANNFCRYHVKYYIFKFEDNKNEFIKYNIKTLKELSKSKKGKTVFVYNTKNNILTIFNDQYAVSQYFKINYKSLNKKLNKNNKILIDEFIITSDHSQLTIFNN